MLCCEVKFSTSFLVKPFFGGGGGGALISPTFSVSSDLK